MPVVCDIVITLDTEQVLRHQGMADQNPPNQHILKVLESVIEEANRSELLKPAVAYEIYGVTDIGRNSIDLSNGRTIHNTLIPSILPRIKELAVIVCTIGSGIEKKASQLFQCGEPLKGLLLDGTGNAALDTLAGEACRIISQQVSSRGLQTSSPLSPGMPGLAISEQQNLVEMVPEDEIGVSLTSLQEMIPRKSLSMVIGIGPEMATWTKAEFCAKCSLNKSCRYKVQSKPD
ncbi:hypothetical protein ACFLYM_00015 [Chloroflexota bacterium]